MLRKGDFKYIPYTGMQPELFNLAQDPEEVQDLAGDPTMTSVLDSLRGELEAICDPVAMDLAATRDQEALICAHGGVEKILNRGGSSYTPIPGEAVKLLADAP